MIISGQSTAILPMQTCRVVFSEHKITTCDIRRVKNELGTTESSVDTVEPDVSADVLTNVSQRLAQPTSSWRTNFVCLAKLSANRILVRTANFRDLVTFAIVGKEDL